MTTEVLMNASSASDEISVRVKLQLIQDTTMPTKASHYYGQQCLRSRGFKTSCNDLNLHKTGN